MRLVISTIKLETESNVLIARQKGRQISRLAGFDDLAQTRVAVAVSSVARSSFRAAPGGIVEFAIEGAGSQILVVRVQQNAVPAAELETARRLMDGCEIETGPCAFVRMEKRLAPDAPLVTAESLSWIADALASEQSGGLLGAAAAQDLESLRAIEQLQQRQAELAQVNQELDDTNAGVMALYAELDERTQQLRRVSELKSRFLSNLSHEVRTPVNSILALSNILLKRLDGDLSPEQEKQVSYIRESAEQLSRLVKDELDLAKVEAGKISLHVSDFHVSQLIAALRGMFKPLMSSSTVSLIFEEPPDLPELHTDEGKVSQILRNLISNALKFTPAGEIRVGARLDPERQSVVFTVADTGIGIAPEDQERIFQEFFQVDAVMGRRNDGAGIGLHLSRQLAELLGGTLTVTSAPRAGTVFTATIPIEYRKARPAAKAVSGSGALILVIDDDHLSRYLLTQNIGDMGCRILEAESGIAGLSLARAENPRLIFLDLVMPDLSGFEVLRKLKADSSTRHIPVVIFTSKTPDREEFGTLTAQSEAIILKPELSRSTLRAMIRKICSENTERSAAS